MENSRREREKQLRKADIIAAAEKIFSQKGFDAASMDEIAAEAQFTKRTLYQYFVNKEDLFFAVCAQYYEQLFSYVQTGKEGAPNGFEKLRALIQAYYQFYKDYPQWFQVFSYSAIKKDMKISQYFRKWLNLTVCMFRELEEVLIEGQKDGSIRLDLEPKKTSYSLGFTIGSFFQLLYEGGENFFEYFSLQQEELIANTFELILQSVRNK